MYNVYSMIYIKLSLRCKEREVNQIRGGLNIIFKVVVGVGVMARFDFLSN